MYYLKQPSCVIPLCLQKSLTRTNCAREEIKVKKRKKKKELCRRNRPVLKRSSCGGGDSFSPQPADMSYSRSSSRHLWTLPFSAQPASRRSKTSSRHWWFYCIFFRVTQAWTMSMFDNTNFTVNLEHFWLSAWELFHLTKSKPRKAAQASGCEARAHWQGR